MTSFRKERVSEMLLGFLGEQVRRLHDPRLEAVTLTSVEMTADLKIARVYWSMFQLGDAGVTSALAEERIADSQDALNGVSGLLKQRIGRELKLRFTPQLQFHFDASQIIGGRIEELLRKGDEH